MHRILSLTGSELMKIFYLWLSAPKLLISAHCLGSVLVYICCKMKFLWSWHWSTGMAECHYWCVNLVEQQYFSNIYFFPQAHGLSSSMFFVTLIGSSIGSYHAVESNYRMVFYIIQLQNGLLPHQHLYHYSTSISHWEVAVIGCRVCSWVSDYFFPLVTCKVVNTSE